MPHFEPSCDVLSKTTKIVPNALAYKLQHLETSTLNRGIEAGNYTLIGTPISTTKSGDSLQKTTKKVKLNIAKLRLQIESATKYDPIAEACYTYAPD